MILLDVTPHALGIMTFGGYFEELIPQNTTVPTSRAKIFTTSRDNQTAVKILVMQGERERRRARTSCSASSSSRACAARPRARSRSRSPSRSTPTASSACSAKDLETGQEQSIQVTATSGLTQDEIKKMMEEAKDYLVAAPRQRGVRGASEQEAEKLIAQIEKLFPEVEQVVASSDFGRDAIEKARAVVEKARGAVQRQDAMALREQLEGLARTQRMFKGVVTKTIS